MDIDRFSNRRSSYNPTTVADASRWVMLCKLLIGQHPSRVVITQRTPAPIVAVHWSMVGMAFSVIYITFAIVGMVVMFCIKSQEIGRLFLTDTNVSKVQGFFVAGLNVFSMYVLFIRLFWHRNNVRDRISLMIEMERHFSEVGIPVQLQRRRTYVRSVLWSFGFVMYFLYNCCYSLHISLMANHPFATMVVAIAMVVMPAFYRQSMVLFCLHDLTETKRFFIQLNEVLREVLQAERRRAVSS